MSKIPFSSQLIAVLGISMGDEGKGRLILELLDELRGSLRDEEGGEERGHIPGWFPGDRALGASKLSAVAGVLKVNGGSNAGHSVGNLKLNLIPAGVIDSQLSRLWIGSGVVADPNKFLWECAYVELQGYEVRSRLRIDERTLMTDVSHRLLDLAWENYRTQILGECPRGSTGRGITPGYADEVMQFQMVYGDFQGNRGRFEKKFRARLDRALRTIRYVCRVTPDAWMRFFEILSEAERRANAATLAAGMFSPEDFDFHRFRSSEPFVLNEELLVETYWQAGQQLLEQVTDVREEILQSLHQGQSILGEFGQAFWLDKRHGFPPNVTASHTFTPEFFQSAGIPVQPVHVVGCCKAYDTKVGTHVFLTEITDEHPLGRKLRQLEFGSTTGRQRMVGWFDAVEKGVAWRYGGYQDLVINKLDALSYSGEWINGELAICVAYQTPEGKRIMKLPRQDEERKHLIPVYKKLAGWKEDLSEVRSFQDLPLAAQRYVAWMVRAILEVGRDAGEWNLEVMAARLNVRYIGVGPQRSQMIQDVPSTQLLLQLANTE